jgi:hypothetical protein
LLPGELTGTSAGIGRCQLHLVGVGIGFSKTALRLSRRYCLKDPPCSGVLSPALPSDFRAANTRIVQVSAFRNIPKVFAENGDDDWSFYIRNDSKAIIGDRIGLAPSPDIKV